MLNLILVGLNKDFSTALEESSGTDSELHHMLRIIFSDKLNGKEKAALLEETLQISVDEEIREELNDMTSLLDGILERREKEAKIIQNMLADHTPYEKIKLYTNATDAEIAEVEKEMLVN